MITDSFSIVLIECILETMSRNDIGVMLAMLLSSEIYKNAIYSAICELLRPILQKRIHILSAND